MDAMYLNYRLTLLIMITNKTPKYMYQCLEIVTFNHYAICMLHVYIIDTIITYINILLVNIYSKDYTNRR